MKTYERKCLETLETALERTAMYEAWRARDPGPRAGVDGRFAALPTLTKADIRAHFPDGIVPRGMDWRAALKRGEISFVRTSGTTHEALTNIWNQEWWNASERASWALNAAAAAAATGSHREAILASALSVGARSDGPPISRRERTLGRFLFLNEYGSTLEWPEGHEARMVEELAEFQPVILEANPSLLARLARWILRSGRPVFLPRLVVLTYEFPSALQLRAIRQAFPVPVASSHGSTEAGYVFMECECGRFHQNAEFCRVELIPLGMDGIGRMLVTTFGNPWFPLLRFEIGDVGRLSHDPCPCGRGFGLTLSSIEGRMLSLCLTADGSMVTHRGIDQAVAEVEGIEEYRLDQPDPGSVILRFVAASGAPRSVKDRAEEALHGLFGSRMEISVEPVPGMVPEKSGKFLLVHRGFPLGGDAHAG